MKEYKVTSENSRKFSLSSQEREIGRLVYTKWYSIKAQIILHEIEYFDITPLGFWKTTLQVKKDETVLFSYKMGWKGRIIIQTQLDGIEQKFTFKQKGILKTTYVLLNELENELLLIQPTFKWSSFKTDYTIQTTDEFDNLKQNEILLLTIIHVVNYYKSMVAAAAAA